MYLYLSKNTARKESRTLLYDALKQYGIQTGDKDLLAKEMIIKEGLHGKPYIEQIYKDRINFSISHTKNYWVCLIGKDAVGIDMEEKNRNLSSEQILRLAKRFFTKEEVTFVKEHGKEAFYQVWVRKEAYIKCKGTGLSENLRSFSVINEQGGLKERIEGFWMKALTLPLPVYSAYCCKLNEIEIQMIDNF